MTTHFTSTVPGINDYWSRIPLIPEPNYAAEIYEKAPVKPVAISNLAAGYHVAHSVVYNPERLVDELVSRVHFLGQEMDLFNRTEVDWWKPREPDVSALVPLIEAVNKSLAHAIFVGRQGLRRHVADLEARLEALEK